MTDVTALPPEMQTVVVLSRPVIKTTDINRVFELTGRRDFSWSKFLESARFHAVRPLVQKNLNTHFPQLLPQPENDSLIQWALQSRKQTLALLWTFRKIGELFNQEQIDHLVIKGPATALQAYGNIFLREFVDLDVFVSKANAARAIEILQEYGFKPIGRPDHLPPMAQLFKLAHAISVKMDSLEIDLHWQIQPERAFPIAEGVIAENQTTLKTFGTPIPTLSPELALIAGCTHASIGHWSKLCWSSDVAHMIASHPNLDWHKLAAMAKNSITKRMLALGLRLAKKLMHTDIPEPFAGSKFSDLDGLAEKIIRSMPELLVVAKQKTRLQSWQYSATLSGGFATGFNEALAQLFCPTLADWERVPLPSHLFILYYPIHFAGEMQALSHKASKIAGIQTN